MNCYLFKALLLWCAILVCGNVWADTVTFTPSDFAGQGTYGDGSSMSATKNGVTLACNYGYGTTDIRCYSGSWVTISSSNTITALSFTFADSNHGGLNASYTGLSTTSWSERMDGQARFAEVTVTYTVTEDVPMHKATFYVNGGIYDEKDVKEGAAISFPANPSALGDKSFVGWAMSAIVGTTDDEPSMLTSANMEDADVSFYAVYATGESGPVGFLRYERVTEAPSNWSGVYILSSGTTIFNGQNGSNAYGRYITAVPGTTEQTDCEVTVTKTSKGYSVFHNYSSKYLGLTSDNNALHFASEYSSSYKHYDWLLSVEHGLTSAAYTSRYLEYNSTNTRYACYEDTQNDVFLYKRIEGAAITYSNYCTTITVTTPAVTSVGWATYVTEYDMEFADNEAYVVTAAGDNVTLQSVTKVRAGVPVLLKGVGAKTATALNEAPAAIANKLAVSTGGAVTGYVLSKKNEVVGFYKWLGGTLDAGKVYLPASEVASAREFIGFDEATGIVSMSDVRSLMSDAYYNLNGQRVNYSTLKSGLYIVNGKKVVIAK